MIKYASYAVTFAEVPDEVCLTIQITNCPHRCKGCHSPYLQQDIGKDLESDLLSLLKRYEGRVTCVCLMGDGQDNLAMNRILLMIKLFSSLKTAIYSGYTDDQCKWMHYYNLDYLKTGPFIKELGGLDTKSTNQRMYRNKRPGIKADWEDITYKFWREKI